MNNSIFIDSSLLVEYIKGSKTDLLETLQSDPGFQLFISQTVVSEYLFYHLAIFGQKSPLTLKETGRITEIFKAIPPRCLYFKLSIGWWMMPHSFKLPFILCQNITCCPTMRLYFPHVR